MTTIVLTTDLTEPGGPAFDRQGRLWCAETTGNTLVCRHPQGQLDRLTVAHRPHTLAFDARDQLWISNMADQSLSVRPESGLAPLPVLRHINGQPLNGPADLIADPLGNVLLACPGRYANPANENGYVLARSPDGLTQIIADSLTWPLSLTLTNDGHTLIIAETYRQRIWSGLWDGHDISWENIAVLTRLTDAPTSATTPGAGGIATDPAGWLYVVTSGLPRILVFSPDGEPAPSIELPGCRPTGCCYDPTGTLGLIVTDAARGALLSVNP
jgi:gluconolactonase